MPINKINFGESILFVFYFPLTNTTYKDYCQPYTYHKNYSCTQKDVLTIIIYQEIK